MDEEFVFQITEEELAQFPEEGNQSQEQQGSQEHPQGLESKDQILQESTEKQERKDNKVKIPSYKARHAHKRLYTVLPKYSKIQVLPGITSCRLVKDNKQAIELNSLLINNMPKDGYEWN